MYDEFNASKDSQLDKKLYRNLANLLCNNMRIMQSNDCNAHNIFISHI
jgi:hypothetical protein